MLVKIFGNGSGMAIKRNNTSFGIDDGTRILVEVPKKIGDLYTADERFAKNLEYVIITHAHHDHFGDIEGLVMQKEFNEKKDIVIISAPDVYFPIEYLDNYKPTHIKMIKAMRYEDEKIKVNFFPVDHPGIPTYGVKIEIKESWKCVGYSSDTKKPVIEELEECNIIFHDCAGGTLHSSEEEVYKIAKELGITNRVYAIHVNDDFTPRYLKLAKSTLIL